MTLNEKWVELRCTVIPHNASTHQIIEMRRAFYAGAYAVVDNLAQSNHVTKDAEAILMELMAFRADILAGIK